MMHDNIQEEEEDDTWNDATKIRRIALFKLKKDPPGRVWVAEIFVSVADNHLPSSTQSMVGYNLNAAACMKVKHGLHEPKVSAVPRVFTTGKQNRTPVEQAMQECSTMMRNKITRNGYSIVVNKVVSEFTHAAESVMSRKIDKSEATNAIPFTNISSSRSFEESSEESSTKPSPPPYVMLADPFEKHSASFIGPHVLPGRYNFHVQPKLDGIFCLMNVATGEMFSRARKPLVGENLTGLADEMLQLWRNASAKTKNSSSLSLPKINAPSPPPVWLVGELYAHGYSFQTISGWVRTVDSQSSGAKKNMKRKREEEDHMMEVINTDETHQMFRRPTTGLQKSSSSTPKLLIKYHVFDVVSEWPFHERRAWLEKLFINSSGGSRICLVYNVTIKSRDETTGKLRDAKEILRLIDERYNTFVHGENYEGAMIHVEPTLPSEFVGYIQNKRVKWLLKYKKFLQEEFLCLEVKPQEHNKVKAGSVELQLKPGCAKQFSATIAMPDSEKKKIWQNRHLYEKGNAIATVKFFCYTDGGVPRFPQLVGFRHPHDL